MQARYLRMRALHSGKEERMRTPPWFEITQEIRDQLGTARIHNVQMEAIRLVECWSCLPDLCMSREDIFGEDWRNNLTTWEFRLAEILARKLLPRLVDYHFDKMTWSWKEGPAPEKEDKADEQPGTDDQGEEEFVLPEEK